jgi:hypothetical protein
VAQPVPVPIEDGGELTRNAWKALEAKLGIRIQPVADFIADADRHRTSTADRQAILDQAAVMFDHLYPHMPFKKALYKVAHPSDFLRKHVQPNLETLSETDFHNQVIAAFSLVRDAHTLYSLPSPYRGAVAFLPFQMRPYLDRKIGWRFIVTGVMADFPGFKPGVEITGWGPISPLDQVQRAAEHLPGGNFFAGMTRGSIHSTLRPLTFVQLPFLDELPEVHITFRKTIDDEPQSIRIPWAVATGFGESGGFPNTAFSVSPAAAQAKEFGNLLEGEPASAVTDPNQVSTIPSMFAFSYTGSPNHDPHLADPQRPDARFGYLRIYRFSEGSHAPGSTDRIVAEFRRIVTLMDQVAPDGLVIDVRGNPGGDVQAAEQMLQMLGPRVVQPAHFHLANTAAVLAILKGLKDAVATTPQQAVQLAEARAELEAWVEDAEEAPLPHGAPLTSGRTLTDPHAANVIGQIYQGRGVALLIDSLTYSAADIFSAGFQDHHIGPIVGEALVTGGGGANVWSHQDLIDKLGPQPSMGLLALPGDAGMSLAIRRCTRVGPSAGKPVEDLGVRADVPCLIESAEDLVADNPAILRVACELFRGKPAARLDPGLAEVLPGGSVTVQLQTTGIASLKFYLNGKPALDAQAGGSTFIVPALAGVQPQYLRIEGYAPHNALLRSKTIHLQQPPAPALDFDPVMDSLTGDNSGMT